jgi:hypothetical protein
MANGLEDPIAAARAAAARIKAQSGSPTVGEPELTFSERVGQGLKSAAEYVPGGRWALPSVFPTAGAIIGGVGGGALGGPPGAVGGEMLGSGAGEWLNQATGITEPSLPQTLLNMAAPGIMRGALTGSRVGRGAYRGFPEETTAIGRELPASIEVATPSRTLYAIVEKYNPAIKTDNLQAAITKLKGNETLLGEMGLERAGLEKMLTKMEEKIASSPTGEMNFQQLRAGLQRVGELTGESARQGGVEHGAYKLLTRAFHDDLEAAALQGNPALPAVRFLTAANRAAGREFAQKDLADIIAKSITYKGGAGFLNPDAVLTVLNRGTDRKVMKFLRALDPAEVETITETLKALAKIRSGRAGATLGTGALEAAGSGAAGLGGYFLGFPGIGAGLPGAIAGAAGAQAIIPAKVITQALFDPVGRELLKRSIGSGGRFSGQAIGLLGAALANQPRERLRGF